MATKEMTWEEWINSEYNTAGYYLSSSVIYYKKLGDSKIYTLVNDSTTRQENKTNIIIPNQSYGHRDSSTY